MLTWRSNSRERDRTIFALKARSNADSRRLIAASALLKSGSARMMIFRSVSAATSHLLGPFSHHVGGRGPGRDVQVLVVWRQVGPGRLVLLDGGHMDAHGVLHLRHGPLGPTFARHGPVVAVGDSEEGVELGFESVEPVEVGFDFPRTSAAVCGLNPDMSSGRFLSGLSRAARSSRLTSWAKMSMTAWRS